MFQNLTARRLPSLTGLRAFEAMARLGGATRAASELHVTHSAVSRQVKALERSLGVRLFEGPKSRLTLTPEGETLLAGLTLGFDALHEAVRSVRPASEVRIAIHASLAVKWLIPRLPEFEAQHPDITLDLCDLPVEAARARDADLVLRLMDAAATPDTSATVLGPNRIGLVVAPALLARLGDGTPRLVAASHRRGWRDWQAATGREAPQGPERTLSHLHYVLDAAVSGMGAAVLPWLLVADAVEAGQLAAPFGFVADGGQIVALGMNRSEAGVVRKTLAWLEAQTAATMALSPGPQEV
jgi:DNA-binding transcriptional LysR family regulator